MIERNIQYIGLNELHIKSSAKEKLMKIAQNFSDRFSLIHNDNFLLKIHIKEYAKEGKRHKYSVHLRISIPGSNFTTSKVHSWNVLSALQESFESLEREIEHRFKANVKEIASPRRQPEVFYSNVG